MRLIDADELMKHKGNCYDEEGHLLYAVGTGNIMRMTTIDAVPVKHGKWNCSDDLYESAVCSSCKWDSGEAWEYAKKNFRYCPNCGARMEGFDETY